MGEFVQRLKDTATYPSGYPFLPCPICGGVEGCSDTVGERALAAAGAWVDHSIPSRGRPMKSHAPVEVRLRGGDTLRNRAGNIDNWRWREKGEGSVEAFRLIAETDLPPALQIRP